MNSEFNHPADAEQQWIEKFRTALHNAPQKEPSFPRLRASLRDAWKKLLWNFAGQPPATKRSIRFERSEDAEGRRASNSTSSSSHLALEQKRPQESVVAESNPGIPGEHASKAS